MQIMVTGATMSVVDPYCKAILSEGQLSFGDPVSDWGKESFLQDLDTEMQEFSAKAGFSEADICSGRALLTICKDVLQSKHLWGAGKKSDLLSKHYNKVLALIDEQLEAEQPDTDVMFSILSEMMLIIGNIAEWKKEKSHGEIPCSAITPNCETVYRYLDCAFGIESRKKTSNFIFSKLHFLFRPAKKKPSKCSKKIRGILSKKSRGILAIVLFLATFVFLLIAYMGRNDYIISQVRPDNKNIIDTVTNWCKYDVLGKALPEVTSNGIWKRFSPWATALSIAAGAVALILSISLFNFQRLRCKCDALIESWQTSVDRPLYKFRYLHKALLATKERLNELEE